MDAMLSTFQEVALCVVIEHYSGPLGKATLQVTLELKFYMYDT